MVFLNPPKKRAAGSQVYLLCDIPSRFARLSLGTLLGALLLLWVSPGEAAPRALAPIDTAEQARLRGQWDAVRQFELPLNGRSYLGALSYQVTDHQCQQVWSLLEAPEKHLAQALPATRSVERAAGNNKLLVTHGTAFVNGSYTVDFAKDHEQRVARFWLDHSRAKDVQDVFGYVSLRDFGPDRCLITVAVAVDPGSGMLASMVRGKIHKYLVRSAGRFARYTQSALPKGPALAAHASNARN